MGTTFVLERFLSARTDPTVDAGEPCRIYIFPTRHGIVFSALLVVMLLGAVNYANNMAYLLVFTLAGIFLICMLHTFLNLRALLIRLQPAAAVFAGEEAHFPVLMDNRHGRERINLDIHVWPEHRPRRRRILHHYLDVPGESLRQVYLEVPARVRGYLRPGRIRVTTTWPLGLFRAWAYVHTDSSTVVYPAPAGSNQLPAFTEVAAEYQTGSRTGTDDFSGHNQYRPGDPIRNIDWKVLAREQGVLVKRFRGSGMQRLMLRWDYTAHLDDVERRLSQLSLWVCEAERLDYHYGLELPGVEIPPGHGVAHRHACLAALATHGLD